MQEFDYSNIIGWDEKSPQGTKSTKFKNRSQILRELFKHGKLSRADLCRCTGLSAPTVSRITSDLVNAGLVEECGLFQSGEVGAPACMLAFRYDVKYVIGVNVGESIIQVALSDLGGNFIDSLETQTKAVAGADKTTNQIADACNELLSRNSMTIDMIWFICVGVPGTVTEDANGEILVNAPDIVNWYKYPLKQKLGELLKSADIYVENAQNLAAVCEHISGCGINCDNLVFVHIKSGIGAGIIINGSLYRGNSGLAGEIGFMMPSKDSAPPEKGISYSKHGSLEREIGIATITEKVEKRFGKVDLAEDLPNLEEYYFRAANGDEEIFKILETSWDYIGSAIVNICSVISPDIVVLGGDIFPLGEQVCGRVREFVRKYCLNETRVELSTFGNATCVHGAIDMACAKVLRKLGVY